MTRMVSLIILAVFVVVFGVLFFQVMVGFLIPMFLAVLLAIIFRPVHAWISERCEGHNRVAAGLTTIAILLIVLVPLLAIVARAGADAYSVLSNAENLKLDQAQFDRWVDWINQWLPVQIDAKDVHDLVVTKARDVLGAIAINTPTTVGNFLLGLFVMVLSLFYFLADGEEMIGSSVKLLPVRDKYVVQLVEEFEEVARAVIVSTIVGAVLQGLFGAIGYWLAGLNSVFLLILLTMLASMIPVIGAAPVWFGAAAWLYFDGKVGAAIMLAAYGLAVMLMVDNVVRPLVLHGRSKLHPLLGLLSVIGGVQLLGPIGVFIGPMAVAFLQAGLNMFHSELTAMEKQKKAQHHAT